MGNRTFTFSIRASTTKVDEFILNVQDEYFSKSIAHFVFDAHDADQLKRAVTFIDKAYISISKDIPVPEFVGFVKCKKALKEMKVLALENQKKLADNDHAFNLKHRKL